MEVEVAIFSEVGELEGAARRARNYIDENFRETIRLQELCACTGIGLRTLQRCFAQHYQISPTEYIKVRRLNAVRRELLSLNPQQCRVTDIAIRNGLPHLGRFSAEYQRFFGELPSQTLKKQGSRIIPARVLNPRSRSGLV
jgi:AraC family ethanolamine operon transcriptional activator